MRSSGSDRGRGGRLLDNSRGRGRARGVTPIQPPVTRPRLPVAQPPRFGIDLSGVDVSGLVAPGAGRRSQNPVLFPETDLTNRREKRSLVDRSKSRSGRSTPRSTPRVSPYPDSSDIVSIRTDLGMGDSDSNPFGRRGLARTPPPQADPDRPPDPNQLKPPDEEQPLLDFGEQGEGGENVLSQDSPVRRSRSTGDQTPTRGATSNTPQSLPLGTRQKVRSDRLEVNSPLASQNLALEEFQRAEQERLEIENRRDRLFNDPLSFNRGLPLNEKQQENLLRLQQEVRNRDEAQRIEFENMQDALNREEQQQIEIARANSLRDQEARIAEENAARLEEENRRRGEQQRAEQQRAEMQRAEQQLAERQRVEQERLERERRNEQLQRARGRSGSLIGRTAGEALQRNYILPFTFTTPQANTDSTQVVNSVLRPVTAPVATTTIQNVVFANSPAQPTPARPLPILKTPVAPSRVNSGNPSMSAPPRGFRPVTDNVGSGITPRAGPMQQPPIQTAIVTTEQNRQSQIADIPWYERYNVVATPTGRPNSRFSLASLSRPASRPVSRLSSQTPAQLPTRTPAQLPARTPGQFPEYSPPSWIDPAVHLGGEIEYGLEDILKAREEAEKVRRAQELADDAIRELEQFRKKQKLARDKEILRKKEETLARFLAEQENDGEVMDLSEVQRDIEDSRRRVDRRQREVTGESTESVSSIENLPQQFLRVGRVLENLNQNVFDNDPERLAANTADLSKLTADRVRRGFEKTLEPQEKLFDDRVASIFGHLMAQTEGKLINLMNTGLLPRVERIEENERLMSKTKVEKKDEIKSLPFYPQSPAKDDVFRKAQAQMNACIKVIERTTNFNDSPFNFLYMVASNSVKIAKDYVLDEKQH